MYQQGANLREEKNFTRRETEFSLPTQILRRSCLLLNWNSQYIKQPEEPGTLLDQCRSH
jgi:hypothetical protein